MIYLIVQMIAALVLAAICGGAIGWLIHRATHAKHTDKLQRSLTQQHRHLAQSQSEISMLSDDYDDLQRRSQDEINSLREHADQIPILSTNLEKSQLLVRQMIQKHESKLRDLNSENESLTAKLKSLESREKTTNTVKAELDRVRDRNQAASDGITDSSIDVNAPGSDSAIASSKLSATHAAEESAGESLANSPISVEPQHSHLVESQNLNVHSDPDLEPASDQDSGNEADFLSGVVTAAGLGAVGVASTVSGLDAAPSVDASHEADAVKNEVAGAATANVADNAPNAETADDTDSKTSAEATPFAQSESAFDTATNFEEISDARSSSSWASASVVSQSVTSLSDSASDNLMADTVSSSSIAIDDLAANEADAESSDNDSAFDSDPFDNVMEVGDELQREIDIDADLLLDGSNDASCLFDPVEHRDDLKQIFGIGPVTEKALNELGITSYSQLAHLKDHDIEKIASALEIVPGRIERDDWVGNARRQLEDVLEEL